MDDRAAVSLAVFALLSLATLVVLYLISQGRAAVPGGRLIAAGVVFALVALWYGLITTLPTRDHVSIPFGNPGLADTALRLAAVMILGGIVVGLLNRETTPTVAVPPEVPRNVPPSL
jgi:hypothetical protein